MNTDEDANDIKANWASRTSTAIAVKILFGLHLFSSQRAAVRRISRWVGDRGQGESPLDGERLGTLLYFIYVSKWLSEKIWGEMLPRRTEQFRKAWAASFPRNLWPAMEEQTEDGQIFLVLKDGTKHLAYVPSWKPRQDPTKEQGVQPS
jgi:hypothetical protein